MTAISVKAYQMHDRRRFEAFSKKCVQTLTKNSKTGRVKEAKQIANVVGALEDIKVPRYSACQQHRANAPADTPLQYFKLSGSWRTFLGPYRPEKWLSLRFVRKTGKVVIFSCWSRLLYVNAVIYIAWIISCNLEGRYPYSYMLSLLNEIK